MRRADVSSAALRAHMSAREQTFAVVCGERKRTVTLHGTCDLLAFFFLFFFSVSRHKQLPL